MFGMKQPSINDQSLYMIHDIAEQQLLSFEARLSKCTSEETELKKQILIQIENHKKQLIDFENDIEHQRKEKFQFSIEELYSMYGQFENISLTIEFHKFSDSAKMFGRSIRGIILYKKDEREQLESLIKKSEIPRTNGNIKMEISSDVDLSDNLKKELKNSGFISGDIYEILTVNLPLLKSYGEIGNKEIPNTLEIKFDSTNFDPFFAFQSMFLQRLKSGGTLIEYERKQLLGYLCYYNPDSEMLLKEILYDSEGQKFNDIRIHELEAKLFNVDILAEEILEYCEIKAYQKSNRIELIKKEIKRSTNKKFEVFEAEYPILFKELQNSISDFKEESLLTFGTFKPLFWTYESFLHIYLRHCVELKIEGHFEEKTNFQYSMKDIRRILKIGIENLLPQINERLSEGKDFRISGNRALYFNGNYYSLHILNDGRITAFHPN